MGSVGRSRCLGSRRRRRCLGLMRRGEIRVVDLEPVRGAEASKTRPAVIVSNDGANTTATRLGRGVVTVVPVTSNVERIYPFQVLLKAVDTGLPRDSKAQAEQVRSVAVERIGTRVAVVPAAFMDQLDDAMRLHLSL
jgi:mRNA interferase MazF